MEQLTLRNNNIIQRFYFLNRADLKTFKRNKQLMVSIFDELIDDDVEKRINMTKRLFNTNCNIQRISVENTEAFDEWENIK